MWITATCCCYLFETISCFLFPGIHPSDAETWIFCHVYIRNTSVTALAPWVTRSPIATHGRENDSNGLPRVIFLFTCAILMSRHHWKHKNICMFLKWIQHRKDYVPAGSMDGTPKNRNSHKKLLNQFPTWQVSTDCSHIAIYGKWPPFCRWHFLNNFLVWKLLYFDPLNCSQRSN